MSIEDYNCLSSISSILADMASTKWGRCMILFGELPGQPTHNFIPSELFTILVSLTKEWMHDPVHVPFQVLNSFMFVLRQLYRTWDGYQLLAPYELHKDMVLIKAKLNSENQEIDSALLDNQLNFGATPKGVGLLHQSGSMNQCVYYMLKRYQKKMQVSDLEKFGYGTLVSQLCTTLSGAVAFHKTGWVTVYFEELKRTIQNESHRIGSVDMDDPDQQKTINNILKLFQTYPFLYYNVFVEREHTLWSLISDLMSDQGLGHVYESQQIGLRMIKHLTSSLNSRIVLEVKYGCSRILKRYLASCHTGSTLFSDDNTEICHQALLDYLNVAHLDELTCLLDERFCSWIGKSSRSPKVILARAQDKSISQMADAMAALSTSEQKGLSPSLLESQNNITTSKSLDSKSSLIENITPLKDNGNREIMAKCAFDELGHQLAKSLIPAEQLSDFDMYYHQIKAQYHIKQDAFVGYDWFAVAIYALCENDKDLAIQTLDQYSIKPSSKFYWYQYGLEQELALTNDPSNAQRIAGIMFWIEALVEQTLPRVYSAFTLNGCSISQVVFLT